MNERINEVVNLGYDFELKITKDDDGMFYHYYLYKNDILVFDNKTNNIETYLKMIEYLLIKIEENSLENK